MFTGIIEEVGVVKALHQRGEGAVLTIAAQLASEVKRGESVAVDGCCLTVVDQQTNVFVAELSLETMQRASIGTKTAGAKVNLERALRVGDRFGGHFVQGHVDTRGKLQRIEQGDGFWNSVFSLESRHLPYLVEKGAIAVDGISLTIVSITTRGFQVAVIPYTYHHTTFRYLHAGDQVNIEVDILAKYLQRMTRGREEEYAALNKIIFTDFGIPKGEGS